LNISFSKIVNVFVLHMQIILSAVYIKREMFKALSNFSKSNGMWVFIIIVVILIIWALTNYSGKKGIIRDGYAGSSLTGAAPSEPSTVFAQSTQQMGGSNAAMTTSGSVPSATASNPGNYVAQPVANPGDLLPKDQNSEWSKLNPISNSNPMIPDLLQAGSLIGLDTIGQTLKNANLQLRSDPVIVKQNVGPWNNSTYEADLGRVPLELGCAC
jgi:hypothetical protein